MVLITQIQLLTQWNWLNYLKIQFFEGKKQWLSLTNYLTQLVNLENVPLKN